MLPPREELEGLAEAVRLDVARGGSSHYVRAILNAISPDARANGVSRSERTEALKLFAKTVLDTGRQEDVFRAFLEGLGFASEAQARAAAEMHARMGSVSLEQAERDAVKLLKGLMAADHEKREDLRRQLFGEVAVHVNGNGKH